MRITERFIQFRNTAVAVFTFIKRHKRASIAVAAALLILAPLLTGSGADSFFPNLVGLGIAALVVRRIMRAGKKRQAAQAQQTNCRCRCHRQPWQKQPTERTARRKSMTTTALETTASIRRLEELVDRLLAAVLGDGNEPDLDSAPNASLVRSVHEARRLRQSADPASGDGQVLGSALSKLAAADATAATDAHLSWLYAEWLDIARRRFAGESNAVLYSPATGRRRRWFPRLMTAQHWK